MKCLALCPQTLNLFRGRYSPAVLECSRCGHTQAAGSAVNEQDFTTLQLQLGSHEHGVLFDSVSAALLASCSEVLNDGFRARCTNPSCGAPWYRKVCGVEQSPQVLLLQLKSWEYFAENEVMQPRRLPCALCLDDSISLAGLTYTLKAILYHSGDSPVAGHYVTVARHRDTAEPFLVFNDACRREIPKNSLGCTMYLPGDASATPFFVTALLYEC